MRIIFFGAFFLSIVAVLTVFVSLNLEERKATELALIKSANPDCKCECTGVSGFGTHNWLIQTGSNTVEAVVKSGGVVIKKVLFQ